MGKAHHIIVSKFANNERTAGKWFPDGPIGRYFFSSILLITMRWASLVPS